MLFWKRFESDQPAGLGEKCISPLLYYAHMNILTYRTIIKPDENGYHGFVPSLSGCHTWGETIEETRENLKEAIEGILLSMKKHGDRIPTDTSIESIQTI